MKQIVTIVFLFFLTILSGLWIGIQFKTPLASSIVKSPLPDDKIPQATLQILEVDSGTPQRIVIENLKIDTTIESVGLDSEGKMDVPKNADNVGWYNLGAKPGDQGSAVMAGHLDDRTGAPAVFYNITKLKNGEAIKIFDDKGYTHIFKVIATETYDFDKVPLKEVFANADGNKLNLITCGGVFDKASRNYSKRIVVYAEML